MKLLPKQISTFIFASLLVLTAAAQEETTNDTVTTPLNTSILIDVRANDNYMGDYSTVICEAPSIVPGYGTIEIVDDTKVRYTPNTGYTGMDEFFYCINLNDPDFGPILVDSARVVVTVGTVGGNSIKVELAKQVSFKIYPNPSANQALTIEFDQTPNQDMVLNLYNILGEIVYKENVKASNTRQNRVMDTTHLVSGMYLLEMQSIQGKFTQKITIQ